MLEKIFDNIKKYRRISKIKALPKYFHFNQLIYERYGFKKIEWPNQKDKSVFDFEKLMFTENGDNLITIKSYKIEGISRKVVCKQLKKDIDMMLKYSISCRERFILVKNDIIKNNNNWIWEGNLLCI